MALHCTALNTSWSKNPLEIHNDHALGAQQQSILLERGGIRSVRLANVGEEIDDRASLKDEPFQDDGYVEPSRVGTDWGKRWFQSFDHKSKN